MTLETLLGNTGKEQLYYDSNLFYQRRGKDISNSYWTCIDSRCNATVSTKDGVVVRSSQVHIGHEYIGRSDFICRQTLQTIKERVRDELNTYTSRQIYNSEVGRMQTTKGISIEEVALYMKPYSYYKSTFEKIRERIRQPIAKTESLVRIDKRKRFSFVATVQPSQPRCIVLDDDEQHEAADHEQPSKLPRTC